MDSILAKRAAAHEVYKLTYVLAIRPDKNKMPQWTLIHISQVRRDDCVLLCPHCRRPVDKHMGDHRAYHAEHKRNAKAPDCPTNAPDFNEEVFLRKLKKSA
jgi:hypothetical protein